MQKITSANRQKPNDSNSLQSHAASGDEAHSASIPAAPQNQKGGAPATPLRDLAGFRDDPGGRPPRYRE